MYSGDGRGWKKEGSLTLSSCKKKVAWFLSHCLINVGVSCAFSISHPLLFLYRPFFFLFTLSCWKNAVRFIAEKTFCLYFRFIFSLFFSLFSSRILTTSTVISQLIISRRVFIKFFNKNSILFPVFLFSRSLLRKSTTIYFHFFPLRRGRRLLRDCYIFLFQRSVKLFLHCSSRENSRLKNIRDRLVTF